MSDKAKLKRQALEFLKNKEIAVISTLSENNEPTTATILFSVDDDFNFYFITRRQTRKFKNLQKNKGVAIVVGTELEPGTIQMQGEAQLLEGNETEKFFGEMSKNKKDLLNLYSGPFLSISGIDFAIFKVKINWMRYLRLDLEEMKEEYYQIIPGE